MSSLQIVINCTVFVQYQVRYVRPRNALMKMQAGCVACCSLVSHVEYAPRAILRLEKDGTDKQTEGRTDGRTPDRYITLTARRGQRDNIKTEITRS